MIVKVTPTVTAGAYHANDCIGGKMTIAGATKNDGAISILQSITVQDLAAQNAALKIYFFRSNPSAGTYTDNAALDIHDTDHAHCIGVIEVDATDYVSAADNSAAMLSGIGLVVQAYTGTTIYALVKTTGTPTYASTGDLSFLFGFDRK